MSNLEVAHQAKPYVRYMVASEDSEPNNGWPYDVVLRKLVDSPDLPTATLAQHIVHAYVKSYTDINYPSPVTQAAFNLSRIEKVTRPLDSVAGVLTGKMRNVKIKIRDAQFDSAHFYENTLWDIADFSGQLAKRTRDKDLRQAVKDLQVALRSDPGGFIIAEEHNGAKVDRCKGVSIYLPLITDVSQFYTELDFAQQHRWAAMLQAYHAD
jgi:hypothetical protein